MAEPYLTDIPELADQWTSTDARVGELAYLKSARRGVWVSAPAQVMTS
ncbi:MAG: hypothetical protein ACE5MI_00530 [Acidimicrobiia bacterium]